MTVEISDLVARFRADTTDLQRGGQVARQELQATAEQANQTSRALQIMAEQFSKIHGGTAQQALEMFQRTGAQPTAAALAQAAKEMENTAAAAAKAVEPVRAVAKAAQDHAEGWKLSESQLVRFGTGLVGIGLGISLVGGAARALHDAISGIVESQTTWERSLVQVGALYGDLGPRIVALSQAQASIPGVISGQQELLQANIAAGYLTTRYGVSPTLTGRLTGQAAQVSGLLDMTDPGQRRALQQAFLEYAQTGSGAGTLEATLGQPLDPLTLARRLGFQSEAGLQALTPSQLATARTQLEIATAADVNIRGSSDRRGLLDARRQLDQNLAQAQGALQNRLEGQPAGDQRLRALIQSEQPRSAAEAAQQQQQLAELTAREGQYEKAVSDAQAAVEANATALVDNERQLREATAALARLGVEAGGTTAKLLSFTGSLEDVNSIARSDIAAQAQGAVASRARMAIPAFGVTQGEIVATAQNTAYQQAYQNFVAQLAQAEQANPIRDELERRVQTGPANQRAAASRALYQARAAEPIQQRLGEAQRAGALVELQGADTQSRLEEISLNQRERYVTLLRETVDLRRLDVQQQQAGLAAEMDVVRAQQRAQQPTAVLSEAQYATTRAGVLARARLARQLQGKDVSDLPSIEQLIQMNVQGQFAVAEAGPAALEAQHGVEVAQRTATSRGLAQQLTAGQIRDQELSNELRDLADLPAQTALQLELVQNNRDQLKIQQEIRDLQKDLVRIFTDRSPSLTNGQSVQDITNRVAAAIFGDDSTSGGNLPLPDVPASRRGPF